MAKKAYTPAPSTQIKTDWQKRLALQEGRDYKMVVATEPRYQVWVRLEKS